MRQAVVCRAVCVCRSGVSRALLCLWHREQVLHYMGCLCIYMCGLEYSPTKWKEKLDFSQKLCIEDLI